MARYESSVKFVSAPHMSVYSRLADLSQLQAVKDNLSDEQKQLIRQKLEEQGKGMLKLEGFTCDADSVTVTAMSMPLTLRIVSREEGKMVKYHAEGAPVDATLWVQVLAKDPYLTKLRVTLDVDVPFFLRPMIGSKLDDAAEQIAEMLTRIPY